MKPDNEYDSVASNILISVPNSTPCGWGRISSVSAGSSASSTRSNWLGSSSAGSFNVTRAWGLTMAVSSMYSRNCDRARMFASISNSIRVPWGRSHAVVSSCLISGSFVSVSMINSKYFAVSDPFGREVIRAGLPEVSCE
jgi:hypothetical protein